MIKKMSFIIDNIDELKNEEDTEFAVANINFLSTAPNSHELDISEDVLTQCAPTALGKWLVGKYNNWTKDVESHEEKETIFGIFPETQEVEFYKKDGYLVARAKAVISKIYAKEFYDIFKRDNGRNVSVEMTVNSYDSNGKEIVESFNIFGVTCLGKKINGSCPQANMEMIKFEEKAKNFYNSKFNTLNKLEEFSNERRAKMAEEKTYKVNKDELKETPWGEVDKTDLRNKVMSAKNKSELVHDVYAVVEDGWEDAPSEKLKYPLMELSGDTFYYNRHALSSALGYAKKEGETDVVDKVEKLYNKFNLDEDKGDEKKMEKKEFSQLEGREIYEDVIERVHKKLGNHYYVDEIYSDHIEVRDMRTKEMLDIPAKIKVGKDDEEPSIEIDYDHMKKSGEQKQFAKKDKKMEDDDDNEEKDDEDEVDDEEDKEDKKEEKKMKKKKMSSDANVDPTAYAEMLKIEADKNADLVKKMEEKDNIIMKYEEELSELRKFKEDEEDKQKAMSVDKEMADVKECVDEKEFKELKEEGMACKLSELDAWKNKVKAVAFERVKTGNVAGNSIWRMAGVSNETKTSNSLWD